MGAMLVNVLWHREQCVHPDGQNAQRFLSAEDVGVGGLRAASRLLMIFP
jgi:hypothetical protein